MLNSIELLNPPRQSSNTTPEASKSINRSNSLKTKRKRGAKEKRKIKYVMPCVNGWKLNIKSLIALWEDLSTNCNFYHLIQKRLNQDCLENYFSVIRASNGSNDNPTLSRFRTIIKSQIITSDVKASVHSNCIDDGTPMLERLLKDQQV